MPLNQRGALTFAKDIIVWLEQREEKLDIGEMGAICSHAVWMLLCLKSVNIETALGAWESISKDIEEMITAHYPLIDAKCKELEHLMTATNATQH